MLAAALPGSHEPKITLNSYLQPLLEELKQLVLQWKQLKVPQWLFVLVCCVSCDIPALRKISGYVGHRAQWGCSKCLSLFPTENFGEIAEKAGLSVSILCTANKLTYRNCSTRDKQKAEEKENGVRYSNLLELPYFDPVRMSVVYNLFLGTTKNILRVWRSMDLIQDSSLLANTRGSKQFLYSKWHWKDTFKDCIRIFFIYSRTVEKLVSVFLLV